MSSGIDRPSDNNILPLGSNARQVRKLDLMERYWNKVRGNRLVPSRSEIDPRGLEGILSNSFVLERIAGGLARFRIAGAHLTELTGLELRQMPISALFMPSSREILSEALQAAFDEPAIVRMSIMSSAGFGRGRLEGELILLPMRSDLGDVDRILGGLIFDGKIGRTPRRVEIISQSRQTLVGYAGPHPTQSDSVFSTPDQSAKPFGERTVDPLNRQNKQSAALSTHGHLKLVVSND